MGFLVQACIWLSPFSSFLCTKDWKGSTLQLTKYQEARKKKIQQYNAHELNYPQTRPAASMGNWRNRPFNLSCLDKNARERRSKQPAPPSSQSRGFCIWEMIQWNQLKPSFFPITQQKDSKQLQARLQKAHDNCQTWFWLVMLPEQKRQWPNQQYTSIFACTVSDHPWI